MKKYVLLFTALLLFGVSLPAKAEVMKAKAIDEISTSSPKEIISVKLSKKFVLDDEITLKKGYILTGKMLNIKNPEKWHHNATFTFIPTSYTDTEGQEHKIEKEIKATYRQKMKPDYKHSEITLGPIMFAPSYIDNTKRMFNGETKEVWDEYANRSTPWGKGVDIDIKPNETIYFNFPE